jgi:hypothetical protein
MQSEMADAMVGNVHPAGMKRAPYNEDYVTSVAMYFGTDADKVRRVLGYLEHSDEPETVLLQNPDAEGEAKAACFMSSAWSRSYQRLGCPREQIHRDFHYQCLFAAIEVLAAVGCSVIRIENPMSGYKWQRDAFICLHEAWGNIRKLINPDLRIYLPEGSFDQAMADDVTANLDKFGSEEHRPIALHLYVSDGLNMRRIFLPGR